MGIQGVTTGDRADKGLQGVTKDYRNFFLSRTFEDSFSWSVLHKNQSFDQNDGLTPLEKILILRFSHTVVFIVFRGFFFI